MGKALAVKSQKRLTFLALSVVASIHGIALANNQSDWEGYFNAGEVAYKVGDKKTAEDWFLKALKIAQQTPGKPFMLGATLNDLAVIYDETERFAEAKSAYEQALAIREKLFGAESVDVATTLNNLANLSKNEHKYDEAEALYLKVLRIYSKETGPESEFMALSYHNLGNLYREEGKLDAAIGAYKKALSASEKSLGALDGHTIDLLEKLAVTCQASGDTGGANIYRQRYLDANSEDAEAIKKDMLLSDLQVLRDKLRKNGHLEHADEVQEMIDSEKHK